jgi:hypothetical protein
MLTVYSGNCCTAIPDRSAAKEPNLPSRRRLVFLQRCVVIARVLEGDDLHAWIDAQFTENQ